ncbi:MAG: MBL fold metallo-hydrolase [Pseudothermotoga sp.]|uniref:MBL fold metallo-hydrolase n=1 Tax=Pseudothermotoga sp. TaxID=2033661 RepID=UPI000E8EF8CE|nr:MBL fold metallo-hydrolase [Pseudothermotoga sp.]HBT40299.1 MBL fold metallo-hydrolase [Pseudothermotoga sp.]HCO98568.1 MBL fold metallo-hydrolase [Pseudothermotoga sp.]
MILQIYSKALYSTWIYYAPERILFDAGEGVSLTMANRIYAIKYIFLTHGHVDHISGLWTIINSRNNSMGDREKPLTIYYPKGNTAVEEWLQFILKVNGSLRFELSFVPIVAGQRIFLRQAGSFSRYIVPFKVRHTQYDQSFGYNVIEVRRRLKEEFKNLKESEIARLSKELGQEKITESYEKKVLTISGDTYGIDPSDAFETEILLHECTFLKKEDRKMNAHAALDEVLSIAREARVKKLVLYHISTRYSGKIEKYLKNLTEEPFEVYYVDPNELFIM